MTKKYNVNANNFTLELVEEICVNNLKSVKRKIIKLREYGFKIAIDDFGTGYSSLSYLLDLQVDYIKIDRTFVRNTKHEKGRKLLKQIIDLCNSMNCCVIIEGVEREEELNILKKYGAKFIQGYYFFKPNSFDSILLSIEKQFQD